MASCSRGRRKMLRRQARMDSRPFRLRLRIRGRSMFRTTIRNGSGDRRRTEFIRLFFIHHWTWVSPFSPVLTLDSISFGGGIFLNVGFFHRFGFRDFHPGFGGGNVWAHDPGHRLGVPYANRAVANRFGGAAAGFRGNAAVRGGAEASRAGAGQVSRAQSGQRFGTQGFERQNPGGDRSAFSGIRSGSDAQMRSDHGFSSMGHAGGGGFGGFRGGGGGGGAHGGGRR
jgi:hypothetical protein